MLFQVATDHVTAAFESLGAAMTKAASDAERTPGLVGRLYLSDSGWLLLAVPNAIGNGAFAALDELGIEQPKKHGVYNAHVSVMRPEEVEKIGGPDKISERGKMFHYHLGVVKTVEPKTWDGVSKVWYLTVYSPELKALRASYGLSPLPNVDWDFHCTIAVRKTGVLRSNGVSKAAEKDDPREYCANCNTRFERDEDGYCNHCGKNFDRKETATTKTASFNEYKHYEPVCPHCEQEMSERSYWPSEGAWRHRGECWEKGAFTIEWPDKDKEVVGFLKAAFDLSTIPSAIAKAPGQIAGHWNGMKPEAQGEAITLLGSLGLGAGMGALTGAISAEPNYRAEAAKRDAFRGLLSGLAGYTAMKGTQHLFNDSGKPPVESAITGLGGLALSKALYGAGYPLERAIFGRPSWDVMPEDLAALREDIADNENNKDTQQKSSADKPITIAVDLDGTLAEPYESYNPDKIEPPREGAREAMEWFKEQGYRVIIFTVRGDNELVENWLEEHEIPYDHINENPDQPEGASGKVIADYYIDDRAIQAQQSWPDIIEELQQRLEHEDEEGVDEDGRLAPETVGKMKRLALTILISHGD